MNDILSSSTIQTLKLLFQKKVERNVIIDPFSCLVKLSLLRFLDTGTKISIYQNRIHFNSPSYIQGMIRFMYGDNREHLHNLYLPIQKCVEWFWDDKNPDMTYMFNNAVIGLKMLKFAYNEYATIQHTIDYYIIIIMQKNIHLISKLGLNILDINKITNNIMECDNSKIIEDEKLNDKSNDKIIYSQPQPQIANNNTNNNANTNSNTNSNTNANKNINKNNKNNKNTTNNISKFDEELTTTTIVTTPSTTTTSATTTSATTTSTQDLDNTICKPSVIDPKIIIDSIILTKKNECETHKDYRVKDMHKFLFELWNTREIGIVINLYKEIEIKQKGERDNIYSNIMSYCSMKENKLFEYIEENSSIL